MGNRNLYGCTPCPECGAKYRWPTQAVHPTSPNMIICDDCDFREPIDDATRRAINGEDDPDGAP